ncbi:hypothetical protein Tco_1155893 [Tanacetum coccineum]
MVDHTSSDDLSNSSSSHSSSDHSSPALPSSTRSSHQLCSLVPSIPHSSAATTKRLSHPSFASPSLKRSRSPTTSVLRSSPIPGVLSPARADLLPPPKRIRSFDSTIDLEDCSDEPHSEHDIDLEIQVEINECITYADALRARIDARVVVKAVAREVVETSMRDPVEVRVERVTHPAVLDDVPEPAQKEGPVEVTYETLGDLGSGAYDHSDGLAECCSVREDQTMPNTRSGATMTREAVNELIDRQVAEALEARNAARNLKLLVESEGKREGENGDDYEGGNGGGNGNRGVNRNGGGNDNVNDNGNGNGNGGGNGYNFGGLMPVARERFQELVLLCTRMVPGEEDKVERFIGGFPDNIQGNVIAAEPVRLQDAIRVANNLMDQKLKGYARNVENKRRFDNNPRDNHGQQPAFKQNIRGQNVERAYTAGSDAYFLLKYIFIKF